MVLSLSLQYPTVGNVCLCVELLQLFHIQLFYFLAHLEFTDMRIDVRSDPGGGMTEDLTAHLEVHLCFHSSGRKGMPLRYNYDKPEKPRTSRVFGYLARFFILFQTEKSSREVVIS